MIDPIVEQAEHISHSITMDGATLPHIAKMMVNRVYSSPNKYNLQIASLFDWINQNDTMSVSSNVGIMKSPENMRNREYLTQTRRNHNKVFFSEPVTGIPSGQIILPAGIGVYAKNNQTYLGTVAMGFTLEIMCKRLNHAILDNVYYKLSFRDIKICSNEYNEKINYFTNIMPDLDILSTRLTKYPELEMLISYDSFTLHRSVFAVCAIEVAKQAVFFIISILFLKMREERDHEVIEKQKFKEALAMQDSYNKTTLKELRAAYKSIITSISEKLIDDNSSIIESDKSDILELLQKAITASYALFLEDVGARKTNMFDFADHLLVKQFYLTISNKNLDITILNDTNENHAIIPYYRYTSHVLSLFISTIYDITPENSKISIRCNVHEKTADSAQSASCYISISPSETLTIIFDKKITTLLQKLKEQWNLPMGIARVDFNISDNKMAATMNITYCKDLGY